MNSKILIASFLLIVSTSIFIYSFYFLVKAFKLSFPNLFKRIKNKKLNLNLQKAKSILILGDPLEAREFFISSFDLEYPKSLNEIEIMYKHNSNVIKNLSTISKDYSLLHHSVPVLEELILNRKNLAISILDTKENKNNIKKNYFKKPSWAVSEFDKKIKELNVALETNRTSILLELDRLFQKFESNSQSNFH